MLPKKPTQIEERMLKEYAGILTYQVKTRKRSKLLDNTIAYNSKNEMNIKQRIDENIPDSILMQSIGIDIELQSKIYDSNLVFEFSDDVTFENCLKILRMLYEQYNWEANEGKMLGDMIGNKNSLRLLCNFDVRMG